MIIKKYQADTEQNAILMAKDDLGNDAIVMNIKKIQPKGLLRIFVKAKVEITAAVDENAPKTESDMANKQPATKNIQQVKPEVKHENKDEAVSFAPNEKTLDALKQAMTNGELAGAQKQVQDVVTKSNDEIDDLEKKIDKIQGSLQNLIEERIKTKVDEEVKDNSESSEEPQDTLSDEEKEKLEKIEACKNLIYEQLVNAEVSEEYANELIEEIKDVLTPDATINNILAYVYQKIILKLGQPKTITREEDDGVKIVFFVGPTGVGKTTTIAKIVSDLKLNKKAKVALITADTYRIAAVEQLKTYANILSIPLEVVYSPEELSEAADKYKDYDFVLVDTAGRSHLNEKHYDDLKAYLDAVPKKEVYLTLSITTKYRDLCDVVNTYSNLNDYKIVFTKLDETACIGNIYNIRRKTGAELSYVSYGQNVPDDYEPLNTQVIAKKLLGGGSVNGSS